MPINTLPARCPDLAPTCHMVPSSQRCCPTDNPCCELVPRQLYVALWRIAGDYSFDEVSISGGFVLPIVRGDTFVITLNYDVVADDWHGLYLDGIFNPIKLYIGRDGDGACKLYLRCAALGYPTGSELEVGDVDTQTKCRQLRYTKTLPDNRVLQVRGLIRQQVGFENDPDYCLDSCCHCYELHITGSFGNCDFDVTLQVAALQLFLDPSDLSELLPDCTAVGILDAENRSCGSACFGGTIHVYVSLSGRTLWLTVWATSDLLGQAAQIQRIYDVAPLRLLGDACVALALTFRSEIANVGAYITDASGACGTYLDTEEIVLDNPTALALIEGTTELFCPEVTESPCVIYPKCLRFFIEATNDTCTECTDFCGIVVMTRDGCAWYGPLETTGACLSENGATSGQWVAVVDPDTGDWILSFVLYNSGEEAIGVLVTFTLAADLTLSFPKTLELDSATDDCDWPTYIVLATCNVDPTYGACCEDSNSTTVSVCADVPQSLCTTMGGTFLGNGTTCGKEGCSGCVYPTDCYPFCGTQRLWIFGVSGSCSSDLNDSWDLTGGGNPAGGCVWTYLVGLFNITITVNLLTSPPTYDVVLLYDGGSSELVLTGQGFCGSVYIDLEFVSWVGGSGCPATDFSAARYRIVNPCFADGAEACL